MSELKTTMVLRRKNQKLPRTSSFMGEKLYNCLLLRRHSLEGIVEVVVGPTKRLFMFHKQILCDLSPFFKAALTGRFREGDEQRVEFLETDIVIFEQFQCWLYSGIIPATRDMVKDKNHEVFPVLTNLYIFGDKLGIPALQNKVIDSYLQARAVKSWTPFVDIPRICCDLPSTSPLRKLFVDLFVNEATGSNTGWFHEGNLACFPQELLFDVTKAYARRMRLGRRRVPNFTAIRSKYYI